MLADVGDEVDETPSVDFSTTPKRWIAFGVVFLASGLLIGTTHLGGRGGRLEPETGALIALVAAVVVSLFAVVSRRIRTRMPAVLAQSLRPIMLTGGIAAAVGAILGLVRVVLGEADDLALMLAAAAAQTACAALLIVLGMREPRASVSRATGAHALTLDACRRLRATDPERAQRMRDAEIQAVLALAALGRLTAEERDAASDEVDVRWGAIGEGSPST